MTGKQTPTQAFIDEIETLRKQVKHLKATSGCQYCNGPLDATSPVGIYECPQCLKNFPDTVSVVEILAQLAAAKERAELKCFDICDEIAKGCWTMDHGIRLGTFNCQSICSSCNAAIQIVIRLHGGKGQSAMDAIKTDDEKTEAARDATNESAVPN